MSLKRLKALKQNRALLLLGVFLIAGVSVFGVSNYLFSAIPVVTGPENMVVAAPYTGVLSWTVVAEENFGTYRVLRDHALFENGTWVDGDTVDVSIAERIPGTYEYMIIFTGQNLYNISHIVMVTVYPTDDMPEYAEEEEESGMFILYVFGGSIVVAIVLGGIVGSIQSKSMKKK